MCYYNLKSRSSCELALCWPKETRQIPPTLWILVICYFSPNSDCVFAIDRRVQRYMNSPWVFGGDTLNRQVSDTEVIEVIVQNDNLAGQCQFLSAIYSLLYRRHSFDVLFAKRFILSSN